MTNGLTKYMKKLRYGASLALFGLLFNGCGSGETDGPTDTANNGTIHISADESFKPVIDSQVQVYEASHPGTKIIVHYKPEAECLRDFAVDSIRMVIATRGYSASERQFIIDSLKTQPSKMVVAYDAIAVITHPSSADSMFTMGEIKDLLTGRSDKKLTPVFDGLRATSTVRFILDSVLRGEKLGPKVAAAESSEAVIDQVSRNPGAVGFIGVSWVGNTEDTLQRSFLQRVKLAHLESTDKPGGYVQPYQANIYYNRYPMVRDLVYTLKERHSGLGHGFANFISGQRGQLVFKRAYLMPAQMRFGRRDATIYE